MSEVTNNIPEETQGLLNELTRIKEDIKTSIENKTGVDLSQDFTSYNEMINAIQTASSITVDQDYVPTSTNPQSGIAVAKAFGAELAGEYVNDVEEIAPYPIRNGFVDADVTSEGFKAYTENHEDNNTVIVNGHIEGTHNNPNTARIYYFDLVGQTISSTNITPKVYEDGGGSPSGGMYTTNITVSDASTAAVGMPVVVYIQVGEGEGNPEETLGWKRATRGYVESIDIENNIITLYTTGTLNNKLDYTSHDIFNKIIIDGGRVGDTIANLPDCFTTHIEGQWNFATFNAHVEGSESAATGLYAHAEGKGAIASGERSHAEGSAQATGFGAHAENINTKAIGYGSHTEGTSTVAQGGYSHAEGNNTKATGYISHAEGRNTEARAEASHAEGYGTIATALGQHAGGKYNIIDSAGSYLEVIGNGTSSTRSNARTLDNQGNAWYAGSVSVGENRDKLISSFTFEYNESTNTISCEISDLQNAYANGSLITCLWGQYRLSLIEYTIFMNGSSTFAATIPTFDEGTGAFSGMQFRYVRIGYDETITAGTQGLGSSAAIEEINTQLADTVGNN